MVGPKSLPAGGWPTQAREYVLVQSECYTRRDADGTYSLDSTKMMGDMPDYVVFNATPTSTRTRR